MKSYRIPDSLIRHMAASYMLRDGKVPDKALKCERPLFFATVNTSHLEASKVFSTISHAVFSLYSYLEASNHISKAPKLNTCERHVGRAYREAGYEGKTVPLAVPFCAREAISELTGVAVDFADVGFPLLDTLHINAPPESVHRIQRLYTFVRERINAHNVEHEQKLHRAASDLHLQGVSPETHVDPKLYLPICGEVFGPSFLKNHPGGVHVIRIDDCNMLMQLTDNGRDGLVHSGIDLTDRDYFTRICSEKLPMVSQAFTAKDRPSKWIVVHAHPIFAELEDTASPWSPRRHKSPLVGLINCVVDIDTEELKLQMREAIDRIYPTETQESVSVTLADPHGTVVAASYQFTPGQKLSTILPWLDSIVPGTPITRLFDLSILPDNCRKDDDLFILDTALYENQLAKLSYNPRRGFVIVNETLDLRGL